MRSGSQWVQPRKGVQVRLGQVAAGDGKLLGLSKNGKGGSFLIVCVLCWLAKSNTWSTFLCLCLIFPFSVQLSKYLLDLDTFNPLFPEIRPSLTSVGVAALTGRCTMHLQMDEFFLFLRAPSLVLGPQVLALRYKSSLKEKVLPWSKF